MPPASSSQDRIEDHAWLPQGVSARAPFAGKYTVERILGQGGMGVVFEARHIRLGQRVAIKVLGSELREYPELVQRFEREARACGALSSRHSVRVIDIDATEDGTPFIVMELLAGRDLSRILETEGTQSVARSVRWIIEASDAIAEAHSLGIIHRDLKPSNLFLTQVDGRSIVKVLDFGIAKRVSTQEVAITQAVAPLGTPQYMSPEQVRCAKDVDARSDVWSLGVTLYELVTGQTPFAHESSSACIASIAADPVPDPRLLRADLPEDFVAVLMRALAKSAKDRYQSVEELVAALAPFATEFDDEEMVSAVRRAFNLAAHMKTPRAAATLDAAEAVRGTSEPPSAPAPSPGAPVVMVVDTPARERVESRSDRTVPPAVSVASVAPRRLRSTLAMAAAAALGLAALVATPRWAGSTQADAHSLQAASMTTLNAAPSPAVEVPVAAAAAEPATAAPSTITPTDLAPAQNALSARLGTAAPSAAPSGVPGRIIRTLPSSMPNAPTSATAPGSAKPLPVPPAKTGVHGGLSNPGF